MKNIKETEKLCNNLLFVCCSEQRKSFNISLIICSDMKNYIQYKRFLLILILFIFCNKISEFIYKKMFLIFNNNVFVSYF